MCLLPLWGVGNLTILKKIVILKSRQKRASNCPSLGWSSCLDASVLESRRKSISGQFMACGNKLNSNSDTIVHTVKDRQYANQVGRETLFWGHMPVTYDMSVPYQYVHIRGMGNRLADLLSRWTGSHKDVTELYASVQDPIWIPVDLKMLDIDPEL